MSKVVLLKEVGLPDYYHSGHLSLKTMKDFPYVKNSQGQPVTAINMYLTSHLNTNKSPNTIKRTAHCLNILVKYCEKENIDLKNFREDNLVGLSYMLQNEESESGNIRNNTTINNILSSVISFYEFFGSMFLDNDNYLKDILNVEEVISNNKTVRKHRALLPNSEKTTKNPIYKTDIDLIYQNIDKLYSSKFTQERTKVLLMLLEHTGARIGELSLVKTSDITNAMQDQKGMLKLTTLKRRKLIERIVPVSKEILKQVNMFVKIHRSKVIRNKLKSKDEGCLFISEKTGLQISANSLGNDFNKITKELNLENKICAHMFRHRFITNIFINLIKQYDIENKQGLKNALLDLNTLKAHVQELTGHKNIDSLDTYIHLAKSELANMPEILNKLDLQREKDGSEYQERMLLNKLKNKEITTDEYIEEIERLKKS